VGSIDLYFLGPLLAGSLQGIIPGTYLSVRVPKTVLPFTLATTLILVASRLAL
jgi:hypothetical protein